MRGSFGVGLIVQQLFRAVTHHLAKGGVHVADMALHVACLQARDERILHGFAKGQRVGQIALGQHAPTHVSTQHHYHRHERYAEHRDQRCQHIRKQVGTRAATVHAQDQCVAWQVKQLLCGEYP